jgi:hypothetical protein
MDCTGVAAVDQPPDVSGPFNLSQLPKVAAQRNAFSRSAMSRRSGAVT